MEENRSWRGDRASNPVGGAMRSRVGSTPILFRQSHEPVMAQVRGFEFPDDRYYLLEHDTWARLDGDGQVTVGLTSLGAHISGEFIEFMPKAIGTAIERDRSLGVLEMSKVLRSV